MKQLLFSLRILAPALALFLTAVFLFSFGLNGDFFFDDVPNILQNKALDIPRLSMPYLLEAAFSFDTASFGRPLSMLSFALNWFLFGPDPFYFKLVNVLLHATNSVLVYVFLLKLLRVRSIAEGQRASSNRSLVWIAFISALLWVASPIHSNTVLYVVQRMVLLSAFFSLIALIAYLDLRQSIHKNNTLGIVASAALFFTGASLAVLAKETALLIPFYLLVIEGFLLRFQGLARWRVPFIAGIGLSVLLPIIALATLIAINPGWLTDTYSIRDFTPGERVLTQSRVLLLYLRNILLPDPSQIRFFYDDLQVSRSLLEPPSTLFAVVAIGALFIAGLVTRYRYPLLGFAVFWFFAGHALESSFLSLENVYLHRNYLPSIGPLVLLAAVTVSLLRHQGIRRVAATVALVLLAGVSTIESAAMARTWADRGTLAVAELSKNPDSSRANYYYARMAIFSLNSEKSDQLLEEAYEYLLKSAELNPNDILALAALAYMDVVLKKSVPIDYLESISQRLRVGRLRNENVAALRMLVDLHVRYPNRIDFFSVLELFEKAERNPYLGARQKAGWLTAKAEFFRRGGIAPSHYLDALREAVCLNPKSRFARITLLQSLLASGRVEEARKLASSGFSELETLIDPRIQYYRSEIEAPKETK